MPERYDYALAAALVIIEEYDRNPAMPKHERLARAIFSILHGMERYEADRPPLHATASVN